MKAWKNPTGFEVRSDEQGDGTFGSPRGDHIHLGTDFTCVPGQGVMLPCDAQYRRFVRRVYATDALYTGMEFETTSFLITMFYVFPSIDHMTQAYAGTVVAQAQDISAKYGESMTPHVHMQVALKPYSAVIKGGAWNTKPIYINPLIFIEV